MRSSMLSFCLSMWVITYMIKVLCTEGYRRCECLRISTLRGWRLRRLMGNIGRGSILLKWASRMGSICDENQVYWEHLKEIIMERFYGLNLILSLETWNCRESDCAIYMSYGACPECIWEASIRSLERKRQFWGWIGLNCNRQTAWADEVCQTVCACK